MKVNLNSSLIQIFINIEGDEKMSQTLEIHNEPNAQELWAGIGGHFDNLGQIINEFLDNSISNFIGNTDILNSRNILITLEELESGNVGVTIEDTGTGIKDLNDAFTLGCQSAGESPLNEHGFGLKHALASANPKNDSWEICTRTEEDKNNSQFKRIFAPYEIKDFSGEICSGEQWPGQYTGTGTYVYFECSRDMYNTISRGLKGGISAFETIADVLCEDLGFVYAGVIHSGLVSITLELKPLGGTPISIAVGAVDPNWAESLEPGDGEVPYDLGGGEVTIDYSFGRINDTLERKKFDNSTTRKYYRCNMSSSGVEIRINGRVLCYNLFKEIWGMEKHNSYNNLLVTINLKSKSKQALPRTRTSKNGLREGDEKLEHLYKWIRTYMSVPKKDVSMVDHETEYFEILKEIREKSSLDSSLQIELEKPVFTQTGNSKDRVRIDMFEVSLNYRNIYEGKKGATTSKDVYQLRMYWDGLVYDGISPTNGILVANEHPESVNELIQIVNTMKDAEGNKYNFTTKTWDELLPNM